MKKPGAQELYFLNRARPLTLREVLKLRDGMKIDRRFLKKELSPGYILYTPLADCLGKAAAILSLN